MRTIAIIPAGGKGTRFKTAGANPVPKQYLKTDGKELLAYTLEIFQKNRSVDEIVISADPLYFILISNLVKKYKLSKVSRIVEAGAERQDSVFNGMISLVTPHEPSKTNYFISNGITSLRALSIKNFVPADNNDLVCVHDAARPLLPQIVLTNAITEAKIKGNALVCLKAKDTLVKGDKFVQSYLDREEVRYVQTPQIFKFSDLYSAMKMAEAQGFKGTDESVLISKAGIKINIVEGSVFNFKVTMPDDFQILKKIIKTG